MIGSPPETELDTVLATTPATRRRLDLTRPVPRELVEECLSLAVQAPNGANRQSWFFLMIDDAPQRAAIAGYYRRAFEEYLVSNPPPPGHADDFASARFLAENLARVPVLLLGCAHGRLGADARPGRVSSFYGSLFPAVWSFMLAARGRGLGTSLTTVHLAYEREVAGLLRIPYDEVSQGVLVPVAYRSGPPPGPAPRRPLSEVFSWNRWEQSER